MTLTNRFNATNPDFLKDISDHKKGLEIVRIIEERRFALAKKLEVHCQKHREQWIVRQAARLHTEEKMEMNYDPPKPYNSKFHELPWNKHMYSARLIVDRRIDDRMQSLNATARRMQHDIAEIVEILKQRDLARQRLNQEVKEIHQSIHRERMDTYHDFEANKTQRVNEARRNHSSPERYVYESYKQQDMAILSKKDHLITQAYERKGFNREMDKDALAYKFTHRM